MIWNMLGIKKELHDELIKIFLIYEKIDRVVMYGSRARGTYEDISDCDICIYGLDKKDLSVIKDEIENIKTVLKFDVLIYENIKRRELLDNIDREGILIYKKGDELRVKNRFFERFEEYKKAIKKLKGSLEIENPDELQIDGILQRFEFSIELGWKVIKDFAAIHEVEVRSPKEAVKEAFRMKLIGHGELWIDMLDSRNIISHTYDEEDSREIYIKVRETYIKELMELITKLEDEISKL